MAGRAAELRRTLVRLVLLLGASAHGQQDAPPPPRLDDGRPNGARLADVPAERAAGLEEIIVHDENPWRLPDLGSTWRARRDAERKTGRVEVAFLPLYDPQGAVTGADLFLGNTEARRVGYIELFRIRFGRRSRD